MSIFTSEVECPVCGNNVDSDNDSFDCIESMCPFAVYNYSAETPLDFDNQGNRGAEYIPYDDEELYDDITK